MVLHRNSQVISVNSLEDMIKLHAIDVNETTMFIRKVAKKNKKATFFSFLAFAGVLYLGKNQKKLADKIDRLEEKNKNLEEEYKNYRYGKEDYDYDEDIVFDNSDL